MQSVSYHRMLTRAERDEIARMVGVVRKTGTCARVEVCNALLDHRQMTADQMAGLTLEDLALLAEMAAHPDERRHYARELRSKLGCNV